MITTHCITYLADLYQLCIGGDHHKDRDCHWSVQQRWNYGEQPHWFVVHNGYCYKEIDEVCDTYEDALTELEANLVAAIDKQVDYLRRVITEYNEHKEGFFDYSEYDYNRAAEVLKTLEERRYFET